MNIREILHDLGSHAMQLGTVFLGPFSYILLREESGDHEGEDTGQADVGSHATGSAALAGSRGRGSGRTGRRTSRLAGSGGSARAGSSRARRTGRSAGGGRRRGRTASRGAGLAVGRTSAGTSREGRATGTSAKAGGVGRGQDSDRRRVLEVTNGVTDLETEVGALLEVDEPWVGRGTGGDDVLERSRADLATGNSRNHKRRVRAEECQRGDLALSDADGSRDGGVGLGLAIDGGGSESDGRENGEGQHFVKEGGRKEIGRAHV